ncbi:hypothetical protein [Nonomuraea sp. NPDC001831]|uniref:hypothetical protein n=1 Tax=Nonomuraea sp. NPDC001831 TaxID=3364340 RepID=UPI0036848EBF
MVNADGAILLGERVVVDGHIRRCAVRVQTHVHYDHMSRFTSSKGVHDLVMHPATRDLLLLEGHPDLAWRDNVYSPQYNEVLRLQGISIELLNAGHMMGSAQVAVEYVDGYRVGYSGDFSWPLPKVIQVDELVVDAAYGSAASVRRFSQEDAEAEFLQLISDLLVRGPVTIKAHSGTLHRAAVLLYGAIRHPLIATKRVADELEVYCRYGAVANVQDNIPGTRSYVRLLGRRDPLTRYADPGGATVVLTGFRMRSEPVLRVSENSYTVCLSDHADFDETLQYVEQTGAKRVRVDNARHGNGVELALGIAERLNIESRFDLADKEVL